MAIHKHMFNIFMVQEYDGQFKTPIQESRLHVSYSREIGAGKMHFIVTVFVNR